MNARGDLRRELSLPTLRTDAVWKERMGAETKALLAMKDLESMMIVVLCFLRKLSVGTSQRRSGGTGASYLELSCLTWEILRGLN